MNPILKKYFASLVLSAGFIFGLFYYASAQEGPVLTAVLHSETPAAKSIAIGAQSVDVARVTLTASGGDIFLDGIELGTDVAGGLSNFTDIKIYDTYGTGSGPVLKGTAPNQSTSPYLVKFSNATVIGVGMSKTYLVRASLSPSAAGNIRLGFSGLTFGTQAVPALSGIPIYSNVMSLPGVSPTPVPSPTVLVSVTPTATPRSVAYIGPPIASYGLKEGDVLSSAGSDDPDIYIVNEMGYKRLFLNPAIFGFYGHLGGFGNVKNVSATARDAFPTSGLFRNCETQPLYTKAGQANDPSRIYALEVTGEDTGMLHWVNTSGAQAVADDANFFSKVFCINNNEFSWYSKGADYTSVSQVPNYSR